MAGKPMDSKESQDHALYELIHESLRIKKSNNAKYLKIIDSHVPSELTESHSLVTTGNAPSAEDEDSQKKINNLYKRINELEVTNDSLRLKVSIDEAALLEDTSEKKDDEFELSVEQLKMQRDMLRAELAKSLEHKKKTDQYSMEAKQHAQRLTAENEQLKESLKRVTSEKEQIEATYRDHGQRKYRDEQSSPSLEAYSERRSAFERHTSELIEKARLHLVREEVAREVAEKLKQSRTHTELLKSFSSEYFESAENASMDDQTTNLTVKEGNDLDHIIHAPVPLIMCSLVIIGLPGNVKNNFIKNLFDLYSIKYQSNWEDKDIVLTKIDIKKDRTGDIQWEKCQGDDCDALRLILHRVCAEKKINVDQALDELAAADGVSSLSESHNKSFRELLNRLKKPSSSSDSQVEMYGMSQVFDFSHKSTAFAQIPVLFTDKKKIITIFVCEEKGSAMYCPRANGKVSLADSVMFWANYLGHFKPDAHSMLVAFNGSSGSIDALLSDLTKKTKAIDVKNIFSGLIFDISQKSGMMDLQAQLNKLFTNIEKDVKLSWLMFHSALIKISEWPWIPYTVVKQLASIFRISKSELSDVMQFWSSITSILYNRDVDHLRDIVFCDTVWLAKELSKVLNLEPTLSNLLQYGIVEQCVAEKHWLKISSSDGKTTMAGPHQLLLDYFTGFKLATVISSIEGKQHLQCACYFIPSLLKPCKDVVTKSKNSLYVQFPQSFMPMQMFSHVVIHLLRDGYLQCGLNKTYLYSNKISLTLYSCCDLTLVEHRFSVEIIYDCNNCRLPKEGVVKMIRDNIEECCNKLSLGFSFQLMCPNDEHYIRVPDVKTQHVHCRTCASHVTLTNRQLYWIVEHTNLPVKSKDSFSDTIPELTIEHLVKIADKVNARDSRRLALELGFFDAEYEHIWSFAHEKRVILYILITWFDRNERIKNKHMYLDRALIATGYRTLAIASTDLYVEQRNPIEDSELRMLAEHIDRAWEVLAFFCDMDANDELMEKLKLQNDTDAAYEILKRWSQSYTGTNPQKELVKRLQQLSLPLVARHFEQGTLNFYNATAKKRFL